MKKLVLASMLFLMLFGGWSYTRAAEESIPTKNKNRLGGCSGTVIVDIGASQFKVPREGLHYRRIGSERTEESGQGAYAGSHGEIKDVFSFSTSVAPNKGFMVSLTEKKNGANYPRTTYSLWKKYLDKWMKEGIVTTLSNGTEKVQWGGTENYLLPSDKAPTKNGEPVMFQCSGRIKTVSQTDSCWVSYVYPDKYGFIFSYRMFRIDPIHGQKIHEEDYLNFDLHWRNVYKEMKF